MFVVIGRHTGTVYGPFSSKKEGKAFVSRSLRSNSRYYAVLRTPNPAVFVGA